MCAEKCVLVGEGFTDVSENAWYAEAVDYVYHHGFMDGVGEGLFAPNSATSRAMIVTLLWRIEGEPAADYEMTFKDVAAGTWYTEAIRWAASEGIVTGFTAEMFAPERDISHEQFAAILWCYANYKVYYVSAGEDSNILSYIDALSVSEYAISAMQWACADAVISGRDDGTLDPQGLAKRCEAAQMVMRFCEEYSK